MDKAQTVIVATAAITAVVVSFCLVFSKSLWDLRSYKSRVISAKEEARDTLRGNIETAEQLKVNYIALESEQFANPDTIFDALPSKYDFPALASSIEKIAEQGGYSISNITGEDQALTAVQVAAETEPVEMAISVTITGTYESIQSFVADLERSIRPFSLNILELRGTDEEMEATLELVTYYQPIEDLEVTTTTVR